MGEVNIHAIVEELNGAENSIKDAIKNNANPDITYAYQVIPNNAEYLRDALEDVQSAITELLQIW